MLEISYIFVVLLVNVLSEPMRLTVKPLSVVSNKLFIIFCIFAQYFDGSLPISVSVPETTQVVILIWHILEAKAVFLSLTREFIVPVSDVERSVEIPYYALVGSQLKVYSILELSDNDSLFAFFQVDAEDTINVH